MATDFSSVSFHTAEGEAEIKGPVRKVLASDGKIYAVKGIGMQKVAKLEQEVANRLGEHDSVVTSHGVFPTNGRKLKGVDEITHLHFFDYCDGTTLEGVANENGLSDELAKYQNCKCGRLIKRGEMQ